jgi:hypothetical protein
LFPECNAGICRAPTGLYVERGKWKGFTDFACEMTPVDDGEKTWHPGCTG